MPIDNIILATDSYKLGHWNQYPQGTTGVFSYLEARDGAKFDETVFFGLQPILRELAGVAVEPRELSEADELAAAHFGTPNLFNRKGWNKVILNNAGRLPVRIKAVPEGTALPNGNVLMTVENTDPEAFWLTNALESLLLHVWYPTTVASLSRHVKKMLRTKLVVSGSPLDGLPFMLHDFGYRGAATHDAAALGGAAHLTQFVGTDTLPALELAMREYRADPATLGFSVAATEHSVMTALGRDGEHRVVDRLIDQHPGGILSVVADSYDIYEFVRYVCSQKERITARDGVFVVRPDSLTREHQTPGNLVTWILDELWATFGGTTTRKGFKVLDPHVRVLWGDGIDPHGIDLLVNRAMLGGYSAENLVFGMGGGLLQKVNRDTQRFAFKSSAQQRGGVWHDIQKKPLDASKASKAGRLMLVKTPDGPKTVREEMFQAHGAPGVTDMLQTVFENGRLVNETTFDEVRKRTELPTT